MAAAGLRPLRDAQLAEQVLGRLDSRREGTIPGEG